MLCSDLLTGVWKHLRCSLTSHSIETRLACCHGHLFSALLCTAGPRPLSIEVDYNAGSGPRSAHSMASGLSRSGSFAPSTLSVLYENQAMKVEREELKSELKLISARVCAKPLNQPNGMLLRLHAVLTISKRLS